MNVQEAVIIANDCLKSGEGIDLFYYMDDYLGEDVIEAKKVLKEFLTENELWPAEKFIIT